jgi:hypothetical protein
MIPITNGRDQKCIKNLVGKHEDRYINRADDDGDDDDEDDDDRLI